MYLLLNNLTLWQQIVLVTTAAVIFLVGLYSFDLWFLTLVSIFHGKRYPSPPRIFEWPKVTIQLPFYNERRVASRILDACLNFDYPKGKMEIMVIDDSNDGTSRIVEGFRRRFPSLIRVIKRPTRDGFKAGALQEALRLSQGELISVFDADYVPSRDLLKTMIPYLYVGEDVAFVQARWGYIDGAFSWYAKAVSLAIDIHGLVDQLARYSRELVPHFNGTAAIFRKSVIESVGGWQSDTLAEDMDLSVRLKLQGYRYIYLPWVVCPGEIPPTFNTLLNQQYRWARGFTECLKKYWFVILRSGRLSPFQKLESIIYLGTYVVPLLSVVGIATGIAWWLIFPDNFLVENIKSSMILIFNALLSVVIYTAPLVAATTTISRYQIDFGAKVRKLENLVCLILFFYALLLTYSKAVLEGVFRKKGEFKRTPKIGGSSRVREFHDKIEELVADPLRQQP